MILIEQTTLIPQRSARLRQDAIFSGNVPHDAFHVVQYIFRRRRRYRIDDEHLDAQVLQRPDNGVPTRRSRSILVELLLENFHLVRSANEAVIAVLAVRQCRAEHPVHHRQGPVDHFVSRASVVRYADLEFQIIQDDVVFVDTASRPGTAAIATPAAVRPPTSLATIAIIIAIVGHIIIVLFVLRHCARKLRQRPFEGSSPRTSGTR